MPHGKNRCRLQLLFLCLIVTDLHSPVVVLIYSVHAIPSQVLVGLLQMQSVTGSIIYGFLFQNPVQSPMHSISHSTEFWICFLRHSVVSIFHKNFLYSLKYTGAPNNYYSQHNLYFNLIIYFIFSEIIFHIAVTELKFSGTIS